MNIDDPFDGEDCRFGLVELRKEILETSSFTLGILLLV